MGVLSYWLYRVERWRSDYGLALCVGVVAGVVLAALAYAIRGAR